MSVQQVGQEGLLRWLRELRQQWQVPTNQLGRALPYEHMPPTYV